MSCISTEIADHLLMYLKMEYKHKKKGTRTFDNFKKIIPDVPNQSNSVDCGVFILQFAESFFKVYLLFYLMIFTILKIWSL
jgi:sentrin-specific protease 7